MYIDSTNFFNVAVYPDNQSHPRVQFSGPAAARMGLYCASLLRGKVRAVTIPNPQLFLLTRPRIAALDDTDLPAYITELFGHRPDVLKAFDVVRAGRPCTVADISALKHYRAQFNRAYITLAPSQVRRPVVLAGLTPAEVIAQQEASAALVFAEAEVNNAVSKLDAATALLTKILTGKG